MQIFEWKFEIEIVYIFIHIIDESNKNVEIYLIENNYAHKIVTININSRVKFILLYLFKEIYQVKQFMGKLQ